MKILLRILLNTVSYCLYIHTATSNLTYHSVQLWVLSSNNHTPTTYTVCTGYRTPTPALLAPRISLSFASGIWALHAVKCDT
jgi:hypothetical protein